MFENLKRNAQTAATATALAGASFGSAPRADAALMLPGQSAQSYLDLGARFQNRVGFIKQIDSQGQVGYGSFALANRYYGITAGHIVYNLLQNGGSFQVGTGNNYLTEVGQVVNVADILVYPTYRGPGDTNNPDIAIVRFAIPLNGVSQVSYGTASPGDIVTSAGYGFAFYAGQPSVPRDGFRRGWNAPVLAAPVYGADRWYNATFFGAAGDAARVNGKGLGGDSGGGVYNSRDELVGINFGQTGNASLFGTTSYLDLSNPEILDWVRSNTEIPAPGPLALLGAGLVAGLRVRRRR